MRRSVDTTNVEPYVWGGVCDGWRFLDTPGLSVIEERVPAGAGEEWHVHDTATQFFYVLEGTPQMQTADGIVELAPDGESRSHPASLIDSAIPAMRRRDSSSSVRRIREAIGVLSTSRSARRRAARMCGRFANDAKTDELIQEYVADGGKPEDWWKSWAGAYSIAPTQDAPIVRDRGEGRILELVRWDWQKPANRPKSGPVINARMEKLAQGFWAPAFSAARCIVPMRGYFEWTGDKTPKTPHFLHGDGPLSAAGLTWSMGLPNGEKSRCFVVITREARDASGEVHDRMPAFLMPDTWDTWLAPEKLTGDRKAETLAMLEHTSGDVASTIREHVVDRKVSNSRTVDSTDPSLLEPVA